MILNVRQISMVRRFLASALVGWLPLSSAFAAESADQTPYKAISIPSESFPETIEGETYKEACGGDIGNCDVDLANRSLFEHGYVNSGFDSTGQSAPLAVVGKIVCPPASQDLDPPVKNLKMYRYVESRLLQGLHSSCVKSPHGERFKSGATAFNLYTLEQNFRHLADDRNPWIEEFSTRIEPVLGERGLVALRPPAESDSPGKLDKNLLCTDYWCVTRRSPFDLVLGSANDRPSATGSLRNSARLRWRGLPGLLVDAETGASRGALDGNLSVLAEVSPRWAVIARGQFNDAEVIDPNLRRLDISSKSASGEAGFRWSASQCPLLPLYGRSIGDNSSITNADKRISKPSGLFGCALPVRKFGDSLIGSLAARDLSFSTVLSYRQSRSFLLGMPFSFSPGAVDGRTDTTALRLTADYLTRGRIGRLSQRGYTFAGQLGVVQGLSGSRTDLAGTGNPKPDFTLLKGQLSYARQLPVAKLELFARVQGQYTGRVLYVSERLSVGGIDSVRGYAESALLADRGLIGSIELGRTVSLTGNRRNDKPFRDFDVGNFRFVAFVDGGAVQNITPLNRVNEKLFSIGSGAEWNPSKAVSAQLLWGARIAKKLSSSTEDASRYRLHFQISLRPFNL